MACVSLISRHGLLKCGIELIVEIIQNQLFLGGTLHLERVDQLDELLQGTMTTCDHYGISSVGFGAALKCRTEMPRRN